MTPGSHSGDSARAQGCHPHRGRRLRLGASAAAVGVAAVALVGAHLNSTPGRVTTHAGATISTATPTHTPRPVVPFKVGGPNGQATYAAVGVQTVPAADTDTQPRISRDEAIKLLSSGKVAPPNGPNKPPDSVSLVEYISAQGDGSATSSPVKAWAIEYDNVTQAISYPANYTGPKGLVSGWTVMIFVDASTGKFVDSFSYT